jgi:acetyl-CoA synthetase
LSKMAVNDFQNFGDTSTVADPGVVNDIVRHR